MSEACQVCDEKPAVHKHHRKLRSQGGGDEPSNILRVCLECHAWIHANPSDAYARGLLVHSWADPALVNMYLATTPEPHYSQKDEQEHTEREAAGEWPYGLEPESTVVYTLGEHPHVEEGAVCPTCERRKPHKKKETTPKSKVWSTRVPLDEQAESFSELVDAAAEHHGLTARPYHRYLCLLFGVTLLLQAQKGDLPVG